jgi:hypothetical protein|tara:strand:- start:7 stop:873 length:867 start_codon:yes stop_codon:yes gene_type:complete
MGSRYGGLKQIDPVGPAGETLLDYAIFDAVLAGFGEVIFVIRRDIEEAFVNGVGAKYVDIDGVSVRYAFQELDDLPDGFHLPTGRQKPWGTAHAVLAACDLVHGPFAVINADDFYGAHAFAMLSEQLSAPSDDYAMVGFVLRETLSAHGSVTRGLCRTAGNFLAKIVEISNIEPDGNGATYPSGSGGVCRLSGDETVSMNFWGFSETIVSRLEEGLIQFLQQNLEDLNSEYLLPDVVDRLIVDGDVRVRVLRGGGPWFGVTYQQDRETVIRNIRELIDGGAYPERLWG